MNNTETVVIDTTEDIKGGLGAYFDAAEGKTRILPAAPTIDQLTAFLGIFNSNRKKLGSDFENTPVYSDQLAVITSGPAFIHVDGAVNAGDLLEPSAAIAGYFTPRAFADLSAVFSDTEIEAEIKKQAVMPRIKAYGKAAASGDRIPVVLGGV
ncbi:MAG: hypothetical protein SCH70_09695 [Candidatus Methanoperedens sp.]|nr:hypothetical protein [Candidatus Methanoperedens sp.]